MDDRNALFHEAEPLLDLEHVVAERIDLGIDPSEKFQHQICRFFGHGSILSAFQWHVPTMEETGGFQAGTASSAY